MAYNLGQRFPPPPKCYRLLDPGSYQYGSTLIKQHPVPFLSHVPRVTLNPGPIWTHTIYNAKAFQHIENCTAFLSKRPRFPYDPLSKQDLEDILCRCGFEPPCECPIEEETAQEIKCQGKVPRKMFKGLASRRYDRDSRPPIKRVDNGPPFYNTKVNESTAFYQGCKWSKWASQRTLKSLETRPGPAEYFLERSQTFNEICAENFRSQRRKTSRQLRYIEMVQQRNILEGHPSPSTYYPQSPKGAEITQMGPKANRFPTLKSDIRPGPADHYLQRDFDLPKPPEILCHAILPVPAGFGGKCERFKPQLEQGPSPASYDVIKKSNRPTYCQKAAFNSSAKRFQDDDIESSDNDESSDKEESYSKICVSKTWVFKSKTIRFKPLTKKLYEQSPADHPQSHGAKGGRPHELQYKAPFSSSEGRFQHWNNWMPVLAKMKTPGPCYYNWEKPKCFPAVRQGPIFRASRFACHTSPSPSPNEYRIEGGVETVLMTHNNKLKNNIENQPKFIWNPPRDPEKLSPEETELMLLNKCIALLEIEQSNEKKESTVVNDEDNDKKTPYPKLLRCFLYNKQIPNSV